MTSAPGTEPLRDLVLAAGGPDEPALAHLVAHGVGQGLDWFRAGDGVAVQVEQRVQLVQAKTPVVPQQRETRRTQRTTREQSRLLVQRWDRWLVVPGWTATVTPLGSRPEAVAQLAQLIDDGEAFGAQRVQLAVDLGQPSEQLVALDLELDADGSIEARLVPERELAVGAEWGGWLGHGDVPSGSRTNGPFGRVPLGPSCQRRVTPRCDP